MKSEDGNGGDDAAECLRYLVATKARLSAKRRYHIPLCGRAIAEQIVQFDILQVEIDCSLPRIIHSQEICRALNAFGPVAILKESVGVLIPYEFLHGSKVWYAAVSKSLRTA